MKKYRFGIVACILMSTSLLTGCFGGEDSSAPSEPTPDNTSSTENMDQATSMTDDDEENTPPTDTAQDTDSSADQGDETAAVGDDVEVFVMDVMYDLPNGQQAPLQGEIVVESGVIQEVSIDAINPSQEAFAAEINDLVVGQTLDGLEVDAVSRASLTTGAFNSYVASI